ncbi:thiamine pyrophosphate-dependent enzyme [Flexivirga sp. B27]
MSTVAELIVAALADHGVTQVWGVVGDALNPVTDAIRRQDGIEWIGVRHEEAAAFAAGAQAQLTGRIGVCMGTVGPGSIHLLNGLYDAKKSHAPVLAICGQVPTPDIGTDFFQEVNNDVLFADVSDFAQTVTSSGQLPQLLEQAVNTAYAEQGVAVLTLPGDVGSLEVEDSRDPQFAPRSAEVAAPADEVRAAAEVLNDADKVTLLVGCGAAQDRDEVLSLAETLKAPMVLTLKAKAGLDADNPYQIGQSGLIGNPSTKKAFDDCDTLFLIGTDFPYRDWYPEGKTVIALNSRAGHIGRRTPVDHGLVGHAGPTLRALEPLLTAKRSDKHLKTATSAYAGWLEDQARLTDPRHDRKFLGKLRSKADNPDERIRPELVAAALNRHASDDAVFTSDTGMSSVWISRFVQMRGDRKLIGSYNLGSMANAMPQALGIQAVDRSRQVIANCGDGGLMMLLGDLRTAVSYRLPVTFVVYDNGRLGMVKLEQEEGGLPEFGTQLDNPDLAGVAASLGLESRRVADANDVDAAVQEALAHDGPFLLDFLTNPDEIALPPKPTTAQAWGFAIAKSKEFLESR